MRNNSFNLTALLSVIFLFCMLICSNKLLADEICDGLSGAAAGICNAATSPGNQCQVDSSSTSCTRLAIRYEQITSETPPWLTGTFTCPSGLYEESYGRWYETDEFSGVSEIHIQAVIENNSGRILTFPSDYSKKPQVSSRPSVAWPPFTFTYVPADIGVAPGETVDLDIVIDVSGLPESATALAIRLSTIEAGTTSPANFILQSLNISCTQ